MGVKKTMDTFFASIQEQSMSGYSGRLVNTPMGPFRWNDTMQLWENVNNGMVMNNISFNDLLMFDYSTASGGPEEIYTTQNFRGVLTNTNNTNITTANTDFWAAEGAAVTNIKNASIIKFRKATTIEFLRTDEGTTSPSQMFYSKNGGVKTTYSSAISMGVGDTLRVGIRTSILEDGEGFGSIRIYVPSPDFTIATIPYKYNV